MPARTEAQRWREEAHEALAKLTRAMDFFLFAASSLVRLTEVHAANDFSHCGADGEPWPCQTMLVVQEIGVRFRQLQESTNGI